MSDEPVLDVNESRRLQLIELIKESRLTPTDFALRLLARDKSTIYRWLSGSTSIPDVVGSWLVGDGPELVEDFTRRQRERVA